jgi:hypothetical protein
VHLPVAHDPRVDQHTLIGAGDHSCAVRAEDARLRHRREALADTDVEVIEACGAELDQHLAAGWRGIGDVFVAQHLWAAVFVDPDRLHECTILA